MIGLDRLVANPGVLAGDGPDAWRFLANLAPAQCPDPSLASAVGALTRKEREPRRADLARGVDLIDLGGAPGSPNLLLYLPATRANGAAEPATWVCWGLPRPAVNLFLAPALARVSKAISKAGTAREAQEVLASRELSGRRVERRVRVGSAATPLKYRVRADTPVREIQHLMLRRRLAAVPVVGASHEMLGIVSVSDVLPHVLPCGGAGGGAANGPVARDVMTRAVYCVAEDEDLLDASRSMIARGVSSLPVVQGGELVGFLSRRTVMRAFAEAIVLASPPESG